MIRDWSVQSLPQPLLTKPNGMTLLNQAAAAAVAVEVAEAAVAAVEAAAEVAVATVFKIFGKLLFLLSNFVFQGTIEVENLKERKYL